jgi:drug/metabolite transporter (DMT)-like permease
MSGAVASWAAYTLLGRRALAGLSPLAATAYAALAGFALLLAALALSPAPLPQSASWPCLAAILYLALGGTALPFIWYYQGVSTLGPARTAVFTNLVPLFGAALGAALLAEPLGLPMLLGGALTLIGVSLANRG